MKKFVLRLLLLSISTFVTAADKPTTEITPPTAKKIHTENPINGGHLVDDYRWLESNNDPEVRTWIEAQNTRTHAYLDSLPQGPKIYDWLKELERGQSATHYGLQAAGNLLFALKWQPGTVKCVSVDALPPELAYLRSGHVELLLAQQCFEWGYRSVEHLVNKVHFKRNPSSVKDVSPLIPVTRQNVDAYAKNWEKWLPK